MIEATKNGLVEYVSPVYGNFYILPLLMLRDFSSDDDMRENAETLLNFIYSDFATEYFDGMCNGSHCRLPDGMIFRKQFSHMGGDFSFYLH